MSYKIMNIIISCVWLANGLFCKILNLVPRHEQIVAIILGNNNSRLLTIIIGIMEIGMALWILSGIKQKINTITQIIIICSMNLLEYFLASELLLWGKFNALFALLFSIIIYYNG